MGSWNLSRLFSDWLVVVLVLVSAALGLVFATPGGWLVDHGAINVVLFVLVLAAAMTLPVRALVALRSRMLPLVGMTAVIAITLPFVAWGAAQLVPPGPARLGILALAVAPAEIATVALTATARGATASAAFLLLVSTLATAMVAAPVLGILAGSGGVRTGELVRTVVAVVLLPFAIGLVVRTRLPETVEPVAEHVATGAVVVLVGLVATQVTLDASVARVVVALLVFILVSSGLGLVVARFATSAERSAVVLTTSMRDFAVASGIAAAAFGTAAAAPLGLYGVLVMVWGSALATRNRRRTPAVG